MKLRINIPGRLPGMNEYTAACREHRLVGARMKRDAQEIVEMCVKLQVRGTSVKPPVRLHYTFFERDRRRDHDNVSGFAHKVVQDALVSMGVLDNDGWGEILGDTNDFLVDKSNPRILIEIEEVQHGKPEKVPVLWRRSGDLQEANGE